MAANQKDRATSPVVPGTSAVLKFGPGDEFRQELRRRIDRYFKRTGRRPHDCPQMYLKTAVVLGWLVMSYVLLVFFAGSWWLAHCVEEAAFPLPRQDTGRMEKGWAEHQVETTVDFARGSRLLSWFIGGLNFQIEHHLFPRICHVHYPALAPLVEETCREFGLPYMAHETFRAGVGSHFRWLRRMGRSSTMLR